MTTHAATAGARRTPGRATFSRALRSELIKFTSLRSTLWCFALMAVFTVGFGLFASTALAGGTPPPGAERVGMTAILISTNFIQVVVVVLGALLMTGEYATGTMRTSVRAVPARTPILFAKAVILAGFVLVFSMLVSLLTVAATSTSLAAGDRVDLAQPETWAILFGNAVFLAAMGVLSLGVGTILRTSAATISICIGLNFVAPIILAALPMEGAVNAIEYLPVGAAQGLTGTGSFEAWQSALVLLCWLAAVIVPAIALLKARDV